MAGETVYDDILSKYEGDHEAAVAAMRRLGLDAMIPTSSASQAPAARQAGAQERMRPAEIIPIQSPQAGFFCPLTGILMRDPVILEESAISYERSAIAWALHVEPGRCPLSGVVLKSSRMHPDIDLRRRIISWASANQPDVLDSTGNLRPFHFRNGVDKAIRDHRAVSAAMSAGGGSSIGGSVDPYSASLLGARQGGNPAASYSMDSHTYSHLEPYTSTVAGDSLTAHGSATFGFRRGSEPSVMSTGAQAARGTTPTRPSAIAEESMYESYDSADSGTEVFSVYGAGGRGRSVDSRAVSRPSEDGDLETSRSRRASARAVRAAAAGAGMSPLRPTSVSRMPEAQAPRSPAAVPQPDTPPARIASPAAGAASGRSSGGGAPVKPPLAAGGVAGIKMQSVWGKGGSNPENTISPPGSRRIDPPRSLTPRESGVAPDATVAATVITQSAKGPGGRTTTIVRTASRNSIAGSDIAPVSPGFGISRQSTAEGVPMTPPSSDLGARGGDALRGPPMESTVNSAAPSESVSRTASRPRHRFTPDDDAGAYVPPAATAPRDVSPVARGRGGAAWNAGRYDDSGRTGGRPRGTTRAGGAGSAWADAGDVYGSRRQRDAGYEAAPPPERQRSSHRRKVAAAAVGAAGAGAGAAVGVGAVMQDSAEDVYGKGRGATDSADGEWGGRVPDTAYASDSGQERYTPPAAPSHAPYGGFVTYDVNDQPIEPQPPSYMSEGPSDFYVPVDAAPMDPLLPPRPRSTAPPPPHSADLSSAARLASQHAAPADPTASGAQARMALGAPAGHSDGLYASAFVCPPQDILLHHTLQERARGPAFAILGPVATLVTLVGFLVPLGYNDWSVADVSENPWIGARRATLRKVGAACSTCVLDGEWWRIFSSLFIISGVAMVLFNSLLFGAAATVAGRTGMSIWAFLACTAAGALVGSVTSAVAASSTIHSTATAIPAAAAAAALVATLAVRRFLQSWALSALLLFLWLALLAVACLAPFADTWATVAAAIVGGVCALSAMAPYFMKRGGKASERWLIIWQVLAACIVVALAAGVVVALLAMPDRGYECDVCDEANCQSILGWDCKYGINRQGSCQLLVFPDSSGSLVCPTDDRVDLGVVDTPFRQDLGALCEERCGEAAAAAVPAPDFVPEPPQGGGGDAAS